MAVRDSYINAFIFSIGLLLGYFSHYQPPCQLTIIQLEIPKQQKQVPNFSDREVSCLADVIYNESRNQDTAGQIAVGAVVINRVVDSRWRGSICGVTKQAKQFASNIPKPRNVLERRALVKAERIAHYVLNNYHILDDRLKEYLFFNSGRARSNVAETIQDHHFYTEFV